MDKQKVCVIGLGFVGSAMATAIAISKSNNRPVYDVVGIDLDNKQGNERVNLINCGEFPFSTNDNHLKSAFKHAIRQGNLKATTDKSVCSDADIIIVDIQLDIDYLNNEPQLEFDQFKNAISEIGRLIAPETLVIIETTVPPGTCEKVVVPTLESELNLRGLSIDNVLIAHSYERVMPGNEYLASITDYWRVFSGYTKIAADACEVFLSNVINIDKYPLTRLNSTTASETAKVLENTYRAVNIAFIDEWTKFSEQVGIDLFEIIDAIRMRPTHSNIRTPGVGVGGYCLTKDPTFAPASAKQIFNTDLCFPFSSLAVQVNHNMPLHVVSRLDKLMNRDIGGSKVLICGVSYRQDIGDTRYSPSELLVQKMISLGVNIVCHDPYVSYWDELGISLVKELPEANLFDAVVFAVPHQQYKTIDLVSWASGCNLLLDANSVLNKEQRKDLRDHNIRVESIGRGDGL